ncbi:hypothetical protein ACIRIU_19455 [Streptomyces sp. NPDC102351]|uniref:hypothetical protein n=1 Tax=Streptomyces sp. NPDC102351 TaxID=3366158 RepID=UPI0037FD57CC
MAARHAHNWARHPIITDPDDAAAAAAASARKAAAGPKPDPQVRWRRVTRTLLTVCLGNLLTYRRADRRIHAIA